MSIVDHHGEVEYPFSSATVFKAVIEAAPKMYGLKLHSTDELSGRITFKAGVTWSSWGENIPIQLIEITPYRTKMKILSTPKTGIMFGGALDFGKNRQNIEKIISAVSSVLARKPKENEPVQASTNVSKVDELLKLKELKEAGVLTDEEFDKEKQKILNDNNSSSAPNKAKTTPPRYNKQITPSQPYVVKPKKKKNGCLLAFLICVIILFIPFVLANDDSSDDANTVSNQEQVTSSETTGNKVRIGKWKVTNRFAKEMKYTIEIYQEEDKCFALLDFGNDQKKELLSKKGDIYFIVGNKFAEWYKITGDRLTMGDKDGVIDDGYVVTPCK